MPSKHRNQATRNPAPPEINDDTWAKLMQVYRGNPRHIDAFTGDILSISPLTICEIETFELNSGGLAETTPADAIVGPLFACIIKKQVIIMQVGNINKMKVVLDLT